MKWAHMDDEKNFDFMIKGSFCDRMNSYDIEFAW